MCFLYPILLSHFMRSESSTSHHPQRGGRDHTGYHRGGSDHLQNWSTTSTHQTFYNCKIPQLHASYSQQPFNHSTKDRDQALTCCVKMETRFVMHKWSILWNKKGLQPAASIHSSRRYSLGESWVKQHMILTSDALNDFTKSIYKFSCLSRTQISSCRITTSDNISTRFFGFPRTTPRRCKQQTPLRVKKGC